MYKNLDAQGRFYTGLRHFLHSFYTSACYDMDMNHRSSSKRMEYQKKLAKPPRSLRDYTPEFHEAPEDWPEFLRLAIACRCYQEDEDRKRNRPTRDERRKRGKDPQQPELDALIRKACVDAAEDGDRRRAERIMAITEGRRTGSRIGPKMAHEILAALGWFLEYNHQ